MSRLSQEHYEYDKREEKKSSNIEEDTMNDNSATCRRRIRVNSLHFNGIKIRCIESRYHISEINDDVLREHFPHNRIHIGDEVIKLNNEYCEHLRNVMKYIETTRIQSLNLRSARTGEDYAETAVTSSEIKNNNINSKCKYGDTKLDEMSNSEVSSLTKLIVIVKFMQTRNLLLALKVKIRKSCKLKKQIVRVTII